MEKIDLIIDFDAPAEKRDHIARIGGLAGKVRVTMCDYRPRRTDRQNRYYHSCFVRPFAEFLRKQGKAITDEEAHDLIRAKFLRETVVNVVNGEPIGQKIRSTRSLSTVEFNEFLDNVSYWLDDKFGIKVPDPQVYHLKDEPKRHGRAA